MSCSPEHRFIALQEKPQILTTIANASQAASNLVNAMTASHSLNVSQTHS